MPPIKVGDAEFASLKALHQHLKERLNATKPAQADDRLPPGYAVFESAADDAFFHRLLYDNSTMYRMMISKAIRKRFCILKRRLYVNITRMESLAAGSFQVPVTKSVICALGTYDTLMSHEKTHKRNVDLALQAIVDKDKLNYMLQFSPGLRADKTVAYTKTTSFEAIRDDWFKERGIDCYSLVLSKFAGIMWCLVDDDIAEDWRQFHEVYAEYELVAPQAEKKVGGRKRTRSAVGVKAT